MNAEPAVESARGARPPSRPGGRLGRLATRTRRLLIFVLLLALVTRLTGLAESLFYWPTGSTPEPGPFAEDVWFTNAEGLRLHGWFMRARGLKPGEPAPAVLHIHGNAGNVSDHDSFSRFLTDAGMHVFIFDYRGYGQSESGGLLRRDNLLRDADAALDALLARPDVDGDRVGVYGVSLGGAFAIPLAAQRPEVRALVTLSAFSSWTGVANDHVPVLGWLIMPNGWQPRDFSTGLQGRPWLIAHGDADDVVNVRHAHELKSSADGGGVRATLSIAHGGDHNNILRTNPQTRAVIARFFVERLISERD